MPNVKDAKSKSAFTASSEQAKKIGVDYMLKYEQQIEENE